MILVMTPLTILACVLCINITAASRKQVCPLQCHCDQRLDGWIDVNCPDGDFSAVPELPDRTISVVMNDSLKLRLIQSNAFSNSMNLQTLHLRSIVPWTVSDTAFHKLTNLNSLHLRTTHSNPLSEDVFSDLTSLTILYLSLKLVKIPHHVICKMEKLHTLGLTDNGLNNVTFGHCFSNLTILATLDLSGNHLRFLGGSEFKAFRSNRQLTSLRLDDCQLNEMGADTFLYLRHLKTLSLSSNQLTVLPPGIFRGLEFLTQLSLESNLLTTMPCLALGPIANIVVLNLNHNKMTNMTLCPEFTKFTVLRELGMLNDRISSMDCNFFQSLARLKLRILHLTVYRLSPLALKPLKSLQYLGLQGAVQNSTFMQYVVQGLALSEVRTIDGSNLNLTGIIDEDMFRPLAKTNLSSLKLYASRIEGVSVRAFSALTKLEVLDLSNNNIADFPVGTFRNLVALRQLELANNFINTVVLNRWFLQESLHVLNLDNNNIRRLGQFSFKGLTKLEIVRLGNNKLKGLPGNLFTGTNIKQLYLSKNRIQKFPQKLLRTIKNLEIWRMKMNEVTLLNELNPTSPFAVLTNVIKVELANFIIEANYKHFANFFNHLTKLKLLTLTDWRLQFLPVTLFLGTHHLDILVLSKNEIASWEPKLFQPLYELTSLELNRNKIVSISKEAFSYLPKLRRLDLSDNALACNCELMWFREWIETAFIYIPNVQNKHSYHCEAPDRFKGQAFLDFSLAEADCIAFSLIKLSGTFSTVIALLLIAAGLVYRFRFEIQMLLFYVRSRQQRLLDGADTLEYVYDAFVIYSRQDRRWVLDKLMAYLENSQGYRLCIEDRDWLGGRAIVDNIIESIESSRRVILVLSKEFVKNNWCVETAEMAQSHLLNRNKNALIPILLADIPPESRRPSIRSVFATRTLLPWPKGDTNKHKQERKEEQFWKTLNAALKKRVPQHVSERLDQRIPLGIDNEINPGDDL